MSNTYTKINSDGVPAPVGFHYMADGTLMSDKEHIELYGELNITKLVTALEIDTSDIPASATSRTFSVLGEVGAVIAVQVGDGAGKFYNFVTKAFTSNFTSQNILNVTMSGKSYNNSIIFPADADGQTYTVFLFANHHFNTELSSSFSQNKTVHTKNVTQIADTTITFAPSTANTNNYVASSIASGVNVTATASPLLTSETPADIYWKLSNADHDSYGFGLILDRDPVDTDWFFETTEAISSNPAGSGISNNQVIVSDLTNITTGMQLIYHMDTTAPSSATYITGINLESKTITFSTSQAFENGETMTFRTYGSTNIQKATGAIIDFTTASSYNPPWFVTVRADSDGDYTPSTTITLNGTYGVGKGAAITGLGVNQTSSPTVSTVSASSSAGSIVMTTAQTLRAGTKLYVTPNTDSFALIMTPVVKKSAASSVTINLNLDNFITVGVGS